MGYRPDPENICPVCHQDEIGYDTDANDGRGGLNCPSCWTEFTDGRDADGNHNGTLVPVEKR